MSNIQIPMEYSIVAERANGSDGIYSFVRPDGTRSSEGWSWKMGAIDGAWCDVRERATAAHVRGYSKSERDLMNNASFATGYIQGKLFTDTQVRVLMAQRGYVFKPEITALETIQKLLVMLNGKP
jgi:hypothetical protein